MIPHLDPNSFIGMSYGDAKHTLEGAGYTVRARSKRVKVIEYDPIVVNLIILENIVVDAYKG